MQPENKIMANRCPF